MTGPPGLREQAERDATGAGRVGTSSQAETRGGAAAVQRSGAHGTRVGAERQAHTDGVDLNDAFAGTAQWELQYGAGRRGAPGHVELPATEPWRVSEIILGSATLAKYGDSSIEGAPTGGAAQLLSAPALRLARRMTEGGQPPYTTAPERVDDANGRNTSGAETSVSAGSNGPAGTTAERGPAAWIGGAARLASTHEGQQSGATNATAERGPAAWIGGVARLASTHEGQQSGATNATAERGPAAWIGGAARATAADATATGTTATGTTAGAGSAHIAAAGTPAADMGAGGAAVDLSGNRAIRLFDRVVDRGGFATYGAIPLDARAARRLLRGPDGQRAGVTLDDLRAMGSAGSAAEAALAQTLTRPGTRRSVVEGAREAAVDLVVRDIREEASARLRAASEDVAALAGDPVAIRFALAHIAASTRSPAAIEGSLRQLGLSADAARGAAPDIQQIGLSVDRLADFLVDDAPTGAALVARTQRGLERLQGDLERAAAQLDAQGADSRSALVQPELAVVRDDVRRALGAAAGGDDPLARWVDGATAAERRGGAVRAGAETMVWVGWSLSGVAVAPAVAAGVSAGRGVAAGQTVRTTAAHAFAGNADEHAVRMARASRVAHFVTAVATPGARSATSGVALSLGDGAAQAGLRVSGAAVRPR